MDTKRFLLATILSVAFLILWQSYFLPAPEEVVPPPAAEEAAPREGVAPPEAGPPPGAPPPEAPGEASAEPAPAPPAAAAPEPVSAAAEERPTLGNDRFRAVFSNRGARLVSFELERHSAEGGRPVDLVRQRGEFPAPFSITDRRGTTAQFDDALFAVERTSGPEGESLEFRFADAEGAARKRFTLQPDGLLRVEVEVPGRTDWGLLLGPGIRNPSAEESENRFARRSVGYLQGGELERLDANGTDEDVLLPAGGLVWAAIQDSYFLSAVMPLEGVEQLLVRPAFYVPGAEPAAGRFVLGAEEPDADGVTRELFVVVQPGGDRIVADSFWGAKEYDRLKALPYGLEAAVDLGWFRILSLPLLAGLRWIHENVVANYGWAIILMTVLIRLLLFPLMHKSTVSMQKMQELNPKIQAIRQKYRSKLKDKQGRPNAEVQRKMNEEVMALYKAEGANPASGCLPLLLQMPVLFAFYSLLSSAIELRHAPWVLWIQDLAAPDPYYVLPIVMGATQFLQQKLTPSAADPMQRRLFQLMPIFFTILFLGFPSGLVLYWLTNNVLGIAQQAVYLRLRKRGGGTAPAK